MAIPTGPIAPYLAAITSSASWSASSLAQLLAHSGGRTYAVGETVFEPIPPPSS